MLIRVSYIANVITALGFKGKTLAIMPRYKQGISPLTMASNK
jgi:hypothetical protein